MKEIVGTIISAVVAVLLIAGFAVLSVFSSKSRDVLTCNDIEVIFNDTLKFVSTDEIKDLIVKRYGSFVGKRLDSVGLRKIEEVVLSRITVTGCEAWTTDDGMLHIGIDQRVPVLRFFPSSGEGFYLDENGVEFPLHPEFTAGVPVICGEKPEVDGWIGNAIKLVEYMEARPEWRGSEIRMDRKSKVILIRPDMQETFIFGLPENIEGKFRRLDRYSGTVRKLGKGYTSVNVEFNNQIICRKDL